MKARLLALGTKHRGRNVRADVSNSAQSFPWHSDKFEQLQLLREYRLGRFGLHVGQSAFGLEDKFGLRERRSLEEFGRRCAGRSAGRLASAVRPESHIPWWSVRPCAAGGSVHGARNYIAICLCYHSHARPTASLPHIGAFAHTADNRGAAADPHAIGNGRRFRYGHF